ncbi:MAG: M13 family peptidase [Parasporobacterium sp.]|nr:M13 family peptidase [Parasporobacterium sp.]
MNNIKIQDDLFSFVNQEWIDSAVIPEDKPSTGGFADLSTEVEKTLIGDIKTMVETGSYPDKYLEYTGKLYAVAADVKKRKRQGIRPALPVLKKIEKLNSVKDLNRNLTNFIKEGFPLPFGIVIMPDLKDSLKKMVYLQGPETILPDTTYYKPEMAEQKKALIAMWSNMAADLLGRTPLSEENQKLYLEDTLKFDEIISGLVKSQEEWSEYTKIYNVISLRKASSSLKPLNIRKALNNLLGTAPERLSAADPRFVSSFRTLFNEENFLLYKHWAYVNMLISCCSVLSEELRNISTSYSRALRGVAEMPSVEKFAYQLASGYYSNPVGIYYGRKYFGEEAKKDIIEMVGQIIEKYKSRIADSDVLEQPTKEKAILKLNKMNVKMGYPDKVDTIYDRLVFDEKDSLLKIVLQLGMIKRLDEYERFSEPVDHSKWAMQGHTVNACYDPNANDITFPAAILQPPFYSIKQSRSQNLGGIGAVIGHEISHAFDNNGANCDENGNLNNWWTKKDNASFKAKTKKMIKQFEGITLPWGPVNASLIVSENIADNGGMAVTLDIMSGMKDADYEEYFINWAKVWRIKARPEYQQLLLSIDVHAPNVLRTNMPPRNFKEWYETFHVTAGNGMYIAPSKRLVIW